MLRAAARTSAAICPAAQAKPEHSHTRLVHTRRGARLASRQRGRAAALGARGGIFAAGARTLRRRTSHNGGTPRDVFGAGGAVGSRGGGCRMVCGRRARGLPTIAYNAR